jgi:hypothetical protein
VAEEAAGITEGKELAMKRVLAIAAGMTALASATSAHALELGTPATEHPYKSAQNFALELRFSPYKPQIDDEPGLSSRPYADTFGGRRLMIGLEFDWQTLRIPNLGTIGPGVGIGYTSMSADAVTTSGRPSGDETSLSITPFWGVAVLRADVFWRNLGFPLVPYGKFGLGYALWSASNTGGTSEAKDKSGALVTGKGGSWGTQLALGVAFALDAIDKGASRNMDNSTGINNTYVFFEAYWLTLNGLGQSKALHVGSNTWAMGLAFEF